MTYCIVNKYATRLKYAIYSFRTKKTFTYFKHVVLCLFIDLSCISRIISYTACKEKAKFELVGY